MRKILFPFVTLVFCSAAFGQTQPADTDDVVKITTKIVQVDVVVTDKNGRPVRDLKATDFDLLQDGKPQKIVGFTFVPIVTSGEMTSSIEEQRKTRPDPIVPVPPPVRTVPTASTRVIAFLIDDGSCSASVWGMDSAQKAVKRFINEQMLPSDQVAIYRTRAGGQQCFSAIHIRQSNATKGCGQDPLVPAARLLRSDGWFL